MRTADAPFSSSDSAVAEIPWTQKTAKKLARIKSMSIVLVIMVIDAGVRSRVCKKEGKPVSTHYKFNMAAYFGRLGLI